MVKFANGHYQSIGIVRLSVIRGRSTCRALARKQSISFNVTCSFLCCMFAYIAVRIALEDRISIYRLKMATLSAHVTESSAELLLVFGAVFLAVYVLLYRRRDVRYSGRKLPPAMRSLPVVGSLPFLPTSMQHLALFCISPTNQLGKIFSTFFGSK